MPTGEKRSRTLYGLGQKRGRLHRYTHWRWWIGIVFTTLIAVLPFTGVLRIDLWRGSHALGGEDAGFLEAARAFAFAFLAVNIAIIVASRFLGRWLCGFVCPIGNMNRLSEWVRWKTRRKSWRALSAVAIYFISVLLAAVSFSFFVDEQVFLAGSPVEVAVAAGIVFVVATGLFAIVHFLGMRFCRDFCPSGVYFALLGKSSSTGVVFAHPETCTDCHACENACPVDLEPRRIADGPERKGTGFYPDGLSNYANCLRCGDCVVACEATGEPGDDVPLQLGWLPPEREPVAEPQEGPR